MVLIHFQVSDCTWCGGGHGFLNSCLLLLVLVGSKKHRPDEEEGKSLVLESFLTVSWGFLSEFSECMW